MSDKPAPPEEETKAEMAQYCMAYFQNHSYSCALRVGCFYRSMGRLHQAWPSASWGNLSYEYLAAFIRSGICELTRTPAWEFYFCVSSGIMNEG